MFLATGCCAGQLSQNGASQTKKLFLTLGEEAGGYHRVETASRLQNRPQQRSRQRLDHLLIALSPAGIQVQPDRALEQERMLRDSDEAFTDHLMRHAGERYAINGDGAAGGFQKTEDGGEKRALAAAAPSADSNFLSRLDGQVNVSQDASGLCMVSPQIADIDATTPGPILGN